jgi:hypothetical protein
MAPRDEGIGTLNAKNRVWEPGPPLRVAGILPALLLSVSTHTMHVPARAHSPNFLGTPSPDPWHFPL